MGFAKMGILFLNKRRLRTALTIIAVVLGVGILTGVNVTADSIETAINAQINARLGINDIIVRGNRSVSGGWFSYTPARDFLQGRDGIETITPRIIKSHASYPWTNQSSGWNVPIIGLDTASSSKERLFGTSNLTRTLNQIYENTSKLEDLLQYYATTTPTIQLPIVISSNYANSFNVKPGDPFYIYPENDGALASPSITSNTSTWMHATVVGIIQDNSESVQDFMPPARVWELSPPGTAVYMDLNKAWQYVFNNHQNKVNMIYVHVSDATKINSIREDIEKNAPDGMFSGKVFTEDVKSMFTSGILQINFLMRGIFSIFSGISLLVCAIIIKNLMEMAKEEQTHEIGVMRAIGVTKNKILTLNISQILFISVFGSIGGLIFGYFLSNIFTGSYVNVADAVGTDFSGLALQPVISGTTILTGMAAGILVSLIFGYFPARSAANMDPLDALRSQSEKPKGSVIVETIKKTGNFSISLAFTIIGIITITSAFGSLFLLDLINPTIIAILFVGVILLIVGLILLGAFFFPVIVPIIGAFFHPVLRQTRTITVRNLNRYARQTKNTFAMLAIGLSMMITVGTIMNSVYAGAYPGGKTITGGDIQVGNLYQGQIPYQQHIENIRNLPSVAQAVPIRYSIGFEGLTRLDRLSNNRTFGGTSDSIFGPVRENFHLAIADTSEYADLHAKNSIVKISSNDEFAPLMEKLKDPYTIILQDRLARRLGGLSEGEQVRLRFDGFEAIFTVVGIFEILPGIYWSYYATDKSNEKQFAGMISWDAYEQMIDDNLGKADVIARTKVDPPAEYEDLLPEEKYWGYAATPMDADTLESIANQTGAVVQNTRRMTSPFFAVPTFQWETNLTAYDPNANLSDYFSSEAGSEFKQGTNATIDNYLNKTWGLQNVLWHQQGSISTSWNSMFSRATVINPETDSPYGNTTIKSVLPQIPNVSRNTVENILSWADTNLPTVNTCVVNEIYVNYNLTTGKYDYIKMFVPGETIRMYYNDSIYANFTVVATTNSHYPYEYVDEQGKHHGDTYVFNYDAMSFNTYTATGSSWNYFFEVMDLEPNSIFISQSGIKFVNPYLQNVITPLLNDTISGPNNSPAINDPQYWWLNQTLQNLYSFNGTPTIGSINMTQWQGNFTYNGQIYSVDGGVIHIADQSQNFSIDVNISNGSAILEGIRNGSIVLDMANYTSVMMFDLNDSMSLSEIKEWMEIMTVICSNIPNLQNITFFSPKCFLIEESGLFDAYLLVGAQSKGQIQNALSEIKSYYLLNDLPWEDGWVTTSTEMEEQVSGILGLIINMFFGVLSFALIVSLLGLAISTVISVRKRYAEIGTLRTLGFGNGQILRMIISEGLITAILGMIVGLIAGLLIAYLVIFNLPFMIFLPIIFTPPLDLIWLGFVVLTLAAVGASFIPAIGAIKIDIAEAIRVKDQ